MTRDEFNAVTMAISSAGASLAALPLDEYVRDLERDEAFGCFFDAPVAWSSRRELAARLKETAVAARAFVVARESAMDQAVKEVQKVVDKASGRPS